jgi:hypothetical protein
MGGGATGKTGKKTIIKGIPVPKMYNCVELPDVTFNFNKSYIRPKYSSKLEQDIKDLKSGSPVGARLFVFGHTDAVGTITYNKKLSNRRAKSVVSLLSHDAAAWVDLHEKEKWGQAIVLETLTILDASKLKLPVNAYVSRGGKINKSLLKRLYIDYMEQSIGSPLDLKKDFCAGKSYTGCSEINPKIEASKKKDKIARNIENEPNRRTIIFAFEENAKFPCRLNSMAPCNLLKYKPPAKGTGLFKCEFYDRIINLGECPLEKKPPAKPSQPKPPPTTDKSIRVALGFPECSVDPQILKKHKGDGVFWAKLIEYLEYRDGGRVVAVLKEEIEDVSNEQKIRRIDGSSRVKATFLVNMTLTFDGTNYVLKATVVKRDTKEALFSATVKAPRLIGVEGYWKRTGKNVWRHVRKGAKPSPKYEHKYLKGLGIDNYRNDLKLMLCIEKKPNWKEFRNITNRVKAIMKSRGYKILK